MQVQVGVGEVDDGGDGGPEGPPGGTVVAVASGPPLGAVDASAEFETNITVKLVAASAMLASPAIFARLVSFNAVTRFLLAAGKRARTVEAQAGRSACHRAAMRWCPGSWDARAQCYRKTGMLRVGPLCSYAIVTIRPAALTLDRWA
jgi:hypothetical protein